MGHQIMAVEPGCAAQKAGIRPGDALLLIDGQPVIDEIDYQAFIAKARLCLTVRRADGREERVDIQKDEGEPLGLRFGQSMTLSPRTCRNKCVFCFIDQMPPHLRETLYVKDDDWRYSLMMGNFVTLTNVDEPEFERILRRRASPLYVSVHATNPELRCRMMNNRFAGDIMERLTRFGEAGIRFHCQVVVCPGYNDGEELLRTLGDLRSLAPAAQTVALVPVGLTKFREGLARLTPFDRQSANRLLDQIAPFQEACRASIGTTFAFPSDEFFCLAGREIPPESWYEDFPQIENGVGLLRRLESEMEEAARDDDRRVSSKPRACVLPTGVSAAPHLRGLVRRFAPENLRVNVLPVSNRFFGQTVTVTGLLTGGDLLTALTPEVCAGAEEILLCSVTLRHEGDLFLDGMHVSEFCARAPLPVRLVGCDGQSLYDALHA